MRIVLSHAFAWPDVTRGAERYLHEVGRALHRRGHEVSIVTTAARPHRDEVAEVDVRYLRQRRLRPHRYGTYSTEFAFGLQALANLATRKVDVWHALGVTDAAAATVLAKVRPRLRTIFTNQGIPDRAWLSGKPIARPHETVVRGIDEYLCYSHAAADQLEAGWGRRAVVVPGGVDTSRFSPADERHPTPVVLFASDASEPRKNLPMLLRACEPLVRELDVEVWLVGQGDQRACVDAAPPAVRARTKAFGEMAPADLASLYGRAWVTALPSVSEAFGLVLLESLACGTPVLAIDLDGPRDIVVPGTGVLVAADDEAVSTGLRDALELAARPETTHACRARAEEHDWTAAIAPRLEAVYARG